MKKNILITGGAGFIGCHVVERLVKKYPEYMIYNLDNLTYAGNLDNLKSVKDESNYHFIKADITDLETIDSIFKEKEITHVIHLAAESHVDRSISDPMSFLRTNIMGTANLLNAARSNWKGEDHLFYHVSTDEVFGALGAEGKFNEETSYDPRSPYSSSKASSDHIVRAYGHTYDLPFVISNCSNNYGPNQFPEKLIPLMINNIKKEKALPIYGKGENVRDWLWVEDHASAIDTVFHDGENGHTYCVGGNNEWSNIDLVKLLIKITDQELGRSEGHSLKLISYVKDRAGHDFRYAIDSSKITKELGWEPSLQTEEGMKRTVKWYLDNSDWMENILNGEYLDYYKNQYGS